MNNITEDITREDVVKWEKTALKYWPFEKAHYKRLNDDGSVTVAFNEDDFDFLRTMLHSIICLGKLARIQERNQHQEDWNNTPEDWMVSKEIADDLGKSTGLLRPISENGSIVLTFTAADFICLHLLLHQVDYAGEIANILMQNKFKSFWDAAEINSNDVTKLAVSQTISGTRLFAELKGSSEWFAGYFKKEIRKHKTKTESVYGS
ncbi:MAG: hypothetical protein HY445_02080 [Candidatus Niyogibacteria bacterium]|nr:hypothetical protein [Candidatus Niyogibacteria bacterium]